tara:strand:+ start:81 stop:572 length:492 start_codon:yes stop_codon:yes gene_type:complete
MKTVEVIDDFLPLYQFKQVQSFLMGDGLPWYYNKFIVDPSPNNMFQFTHTFFDLKPPWSGPAMYYDMMKVFLQPLGVKDLYRIKANLQTKTIVHRKGGYHIDFSDVTTAVYYANTNNGWTHIKGHGKVKSVANRIVIFNSNLEHSGYSCTDEKTRVVLNFNWT